MYQIYALKYAERDTTACQFLFRALSSLRPSASLR